MKKAILAVVACLVTALTLPLHAGDQVDDSSIAASIKAGLLDHKDTSSMSINVESFQGTVQLSGFVESQTEKDAAATVAGRVSGVKTVINSLSLAPKTSMGTKFDDAVLTSRVKAALIDDAEVKSLQINVETRNGVTQLAGFVSNEAMRERAGKVAAGVAGLKQVENALVVQPKE